MNAYTTTLQLFNQPANQSSVTVNVVASSMFVTGEILVMASGGYYQATIVNSTAITLLNLGYPGNAVAGTSIPIGTLSAGGLQGPQGPQGIFFEKKNEFLLIFFFDFIKKRYPGEHRFTRAFRRECIHDHFASV